QVAGSLALVAIALALSSGRRVPLERELGIAVVRSFVQLIALGYVIKLIFEAGNLGFTVPLLAAMVVFGAFTARHRARRVPNGFWVLLFALGVSAAATLGLALVVGALPATARTIVGMLLGGAAPLDAIRLQLILFYLLAGGVAIAVVLAATLAYRGFFTPAHQLRDPSPFVIP